MCRFYSNVIYNESNLDRVNLSYVSRYLDLNKDIISLEGDGFLVYRN